MTNSTTNLVEDARIKKIHVDTEFAWSKDLQGTENILELDID